MIVVVLQITHKHGTHTTVYAHEDAAREALEQYCTDCWTEWHPNQDPSDQTPLIDQYFNSTNGNEYYSLETRLVRDSSGMEVVKYQPEIVWKQSLKEVGTDDEEGGGPWTKLLGQIEIAGVPHHIEAWAVKIDKEFNQTPVSMDTNYEEMMALTEGAGVTVELNGHDYFMVVTPHQL